MSWFGFGFPDDEFSVEGDPSAVRNSAAGYGSFGGTLENARDALGRLDSSSWKGDESDTWREQVRTFPRGPTRVQRRSVTPSRLSRPSPMTWRRLRGR